MLTGIESLFSPGERSTSCSGVLLEPFIPESSESCTVCTFDDSTSACTFRCATVAVTEGCSTKTVSIRALSHVSRNTGNQMPLVTKRGPQSQPYSYAALRTYTFASVCVLPRHGSLSATSWAALIGEGKY